MSVAYRTQETPVDENEAARNEWIDMLERANAPESGEDRDYEDPGIPDLIERGNPDYDSDSDGDDSIPRLPRQWADSDSDSDDDYEFSDSEGGESEFEFEAMAHRDDEDPTATPPTYLEMARDAWTAIFDGNQAHDEAETQALPTEAEVVLTADNLLNNHPIGDVLGEKLDEHTRLYFNNFNGFQLDGQGGKFEAICKETLNIQADLMCGAEHNLDTIKSYVRNTLYATAKRTLEHHQLAIASSDLPSSNNYKPGGTFILASGDICGKILGKSINDPMGRWTQLRIAGRDNLVLNVFCAYQVCKKNVKTAMKKDKFTAIAQQISMLRRDGVNDPNPRKQFRKDLLKCMKKCITDKEEILLVGDFNEALGSDHQGMAKIFRELHLVDIMSAMHGVQEVSTYARGKERLDYAGGTARVAEACENGGYDPFNLRFYSDHRGFFLDFNTERLLGTIHHPMAPKALRAVKAKDPKGNTNYIRTKYAHLEHQKFFRDLDILSEIQEPNHDLAERLDKEMIRAAKTAAKRCKKRRNTRWSRKLDLARKRKTVLQTVLTQHRTKRDMSQPIQSLQTQGASDFIIPMMVKECQAKLKEMQKEISDIIKNDFKVRHDELRDLVATLEASGDDEKKKKILARLIKAEELKSVFQKLQAVRGRMGSKGLSYIEVPVDPNADPKLCTEWKKIDMPDEIVKYLLERNQKHFGQANGTPLTCPPLSDILDWSASTETADLILEGDYDDDELDEITALMLRHMKRSTTLDSLSLQITEESLVNRVKKWDEGTSTSPSGIDLGHIHALIQRHSIDKEDSEFAELEMQRKELIRAHVVLINYALRFGYSYQRWKTVVNIMIEKDQNNPKIHRLRVIHIYEWDYNLLLGMQWREMIYNSEKLGTLNEGQFGSRPGHRASDVTMIEEMKNEISRASRKSIINFDKDATSCYDRILAALASLASRKHGVQRTVVMVNAKTLEEAKFKIKTMLGVTEEFYQHCELFPIYGTGQGSGNSPQIWCIISSVLFDCHAERAHGATFESPDRRESITMYMIGFVDDSTSSVNDFFSNTQPDPEVLVGMMREDAQLWNDLLWSSGGALELPKCSYHYLHYNFTPNGSPILRPGRIGPNLVIQTGDRKGEQVIPPMSAYKAHKTLGHYKSPAGGEVKQIEILRKQSDLLALQAETANMTRREAWTFYFAMYLTSVGYPLPNCHIRWKDLDRIQRRAMNAIISKCGFNRNMHRSIVYGPSLYSGAGFRHLYTVQGEGGVTSLIRNIRHGGNVGRIQRIAISWCQLVAGTGVSIFRDVSTKLPHLENKWIPSIRTFLHSINGQLELDEDYVPPTQRENDSYIMDYVLRSGKFKAWEIRLVNYCRMYLQCTTVSDITLANGIYIDEGMMKGRPSLLSSTTKWHHVYQARPAEQSWTVWRRALKLFSDNNGRLRITLGKWTAPSHKLRRNWPVWYDPISEDIYFYKIGHYERHRRLNRLHRYQPDSTEALPAIPSRSFPICVIDQGLEWQLQLPIHPILPIPPAPVHHTFQDYIKSLDNWETELFVDLKLHRRETELIDLMVAAIPCEIEEALVSPGTKFQLIGVSDGSVMQFSTFGWVCCLADGEEELVSCAGPVFGAKPSSFRAEGYGMLSLARFLYRLFHYCNRLDELEMLFGCDNQGLLQRILALTNQSFANPSTTMAPDWDIVQAIVQTFRLLPVMPAITHVKGHQDDNAAIENLSILARSNCAADKLATTHNRLRGKKCSSVPRIAGNPIQLHINGETINSKYEQAIRFAASAPAIIKQIKRRNDWNDETFHSVDWEAQRIASNRRYGERVHIVKLCHDILPTGKMVNRYDKLTPHECIHCQSPYEDRDHILRCEHSTRKAWRDKFITDLTARCESLKTRPILQDILIHGLKRWFRFETDLPVTGYPLITHDLINAQNAIGWRQIFNGRMCTEWADLQGKWLRQISNDDKKLSGQLWTSAITGRTWTSWQTLWELRNGDVHGRDENTRQIATMLKVKRELTEIYKLKGKVMPVDAPAFRASVAAHIAATPGVDDLQNWLTLYKTNLQSSAIEAAKYGVQGIADIRDWLLGAGIPRHVDPNV